MRYYLRIISIFFCFLVLWYSISFWSLNLVFNKVQSLTSIDFYGFENDVIYTWETLSSMIKNNDVKLKSLYENALTKNIDNPKKYVATLIFLNWLQKYHNLLTLDTFSNKNNSYDMKSDDSLYKFVTNNVSYTNIEYQPKNLVFLNSVYISSPWNLMVREELQKPLYDLAKLYYEKFGERLNIISWYRSYSRQKDVFANCIKKNWSISKANYWCAKPWYSEHQSGLAIDIMNFPVSKDDIIDSYYAGIWWLSFFIKKYEKYRRFYNNAYKYWFHNSYQKWIATDGYNIESWHWRYLWPDLAKLLYDNNLSYSQYNSIN